MRKERERGLYRVVPAEIPDDPTNSYLNDVREYAEKILEARNLPSPWPDFKERGLHEIAETDSAAQHAYEVLRYLSLVKDAMRKLHYVVGNDVDKLTQNLIRLVTAHEHALTNRFFEKPVRAGQGTQKGGKKGGTRTQEKVREANKQRYDVIVQKAEELKKRLVIEFGEEKANAKLPGKVCQNFKSKTGYPTSTARYRQILKEFHVIPKR